MCTYINTRMAGGGKKPAGDALSVRLWGNLNWFLRQETRAL